MGVLRSFLLNIRTVDRRRLVVFFAVLGPGLITANAGNDAGGIATYSVAGAQEGYGLLWALLLMTFLLGVIQEMSARMGVVTGKGFAGLTRERFGVRITLVMMLLLIVANLMVTIAQFAGVAAALELFGVSKLVSVPIAAALVWALVVKGKYKNIERVFLVLCLLYFSYVISGILADPPWGEVFASMVRPSFRLEGGYVYMFIALVGTTISPYMQFFLQSSVADKGIKVEDYPYTKVEVLSGAFVTTFVAFFIMVAAAAVLFTNGMSVDSAEEAALALRPLAGNYAYILFSIGLLNASLLAASVLPLSTAYAVSEAFGWESGMDRDFDEAPQFLGLYTGFIVIGAAVVLLPDVPLISLMVLSQAANGVLLPIILVVMLKLINDPEIMGEHVNGPVFNTAAWVTAAALIFMTAMLMVMTAFPGLTGKG